MPHVEPVEPRQLFAALTADPTFNGGHGVSLPDGSRLGVLATHGAIYVQGVSNKGVYHIYRYTDAGKLDTTWGDGGSVRPKITRGIHDQYTDAPDLVYDTRTGGLLVSTSHGRTISIERLDAAGHDDTAWGVGGVVEYTEKRATFTVDRIQPLAGKKLVLAADRAAVSSDTSAVTYDADDLVLGRINREGKFDKAFNGGQFVTVMAGHSTRLPYNQSYGTGFRLNDSVPTFGDLQTTDSGYRVVGFRQRATGRVVYDGVNADGDYYYTDTGNLSLESVNVASDGTAAAPVATQLYHDSVSDARSAESRYTPILAVDNGTDGVSALVRRDDVGPINYPSAFSVAIRQVQGVRYPPSNPLGGGVKSVDPQDVFRDAAGRVYLQLGDTTYRYSPTLALDSTFGNGGSATTQSLVSAKAADDTGRVVLVQGLQSNLVLRRYA